MLAAADALAADLARHGVRAGQRVGVWLPSRIESVVALLACSKSGAICCPSLHRDHTVGEVVELMQRTRAVAFIWQDGYGADADKRDPIEALEGGADACGTSIGLSRWPRPTPAPFAALAAGQSDSTRTKPIPTRSSIWRSPPAPPASRRA